MWIDKTVERALFNWQKWRKSLIAQWSDLSTELDKLDLKQLKLIAAKALDRLDFPSSTWLQLYWICCVVSDYHFDYEDSFDNIVIPNWLPMPFDPPISLQIEPGIRMYPPAIYTERDIQFLASKLGTWILGVDITLLSDRMGWLGILIPSHHEVCSLLEELRGRPKESRKVGKHPDYSDRIAIKCAVLKDESPITYVEIAKKLGLPIKPDVFGVRSDTVRHLTSRGRNLISSLPDLA